MKLLIVTQVLDKNHPILGFFHRWVEEFAKHCEKVHVICLQEGEYTLPANVTVHSLGKEKGVGRLGYILKFYKLIFSLRNDYDHVFVHMNQIYVILGALFWRILGKKVGLWYAHGAVPNSLKVATFFTNIIFTSTPEGFRIKTDKVKIVGQGIDTKVFVPAEKSPSEVLRLITVGRISPSKNIDTLLRACALLRDSDIAFHFKIIGVPTTETEHIYATKMATLATELSLVNQIEWVGAVPNVSLPSYLQKADIFIHDGSTNSLDKALIEASLCGCVVVSSNPAYQSETINIAPQYLYPSGDEKALADILKREYQNESISIAVQQHLKNRYDISSLISGIVFEY